MDGLYYFMRKLRTIEMNRLSLEEFKEADKLPLIVVLDDVRSLHNVGSVFRSADAFRVEAVYLCGITATPPNAEIHKTALGGEDSVDWRYFERTEDAIEELHRQGVFVYSVEQVEGSTKLQELNTENPTNHQHPTPNTQHPFLTPTIISDTYRIWSTCVPVRVCILVVWAMESCLKMVYMYS